MNEYKNVCWNPSDLISCKQAYTILINDGCSYEELQDLDFGNLDTDSVYSEIVDD